MTLASGIKSLRMHTSVVKSFQYTPIRSVPSRVAEKSVLDPVLDPRYNILRTLVYSHTTEYIKDEQGTSQEIMASVESNAHPLSLQSCVPPIATISWRLEWNEECTLQGRGSVSLDGGKNENQMQLLVLAHADISCYRECRRWRLSVAIRILFPHLWSLPPINSKTVMHILESKAMLQHSKTTLPYAKGLEIHFTHLQTFPSQTKKGNIALVNHKSYKNFLKISWLVSQPSDTSGAKAQVRKQAWLPGIPFFIEEEQGAKDDDKGQTKSQPRVDPTRSSFVPASTRRTPITTQ